jgi:hypothetical protein
MVEGKVNESFGQTIEEWFTDSSPGKEKRFKYLMEKLGLTAQPKGGLRYQLFHRAAAAVVTGEQFRAAAAILLVHSFTEAREGWADYQAFLKQWDVKAAPGAVQRVSTQCAVPLYAVWIDGNRDYLKS